MNSERDIVINIANLNGIRISEMLKVKDEDAENVNRVRHICRNGVSFLDRKVFDFSYPLDNIGRSFKRINCSVWNCPFCGKTYYNVAKFNLSPMPVY